MFGGSTTTDYNYALLEFHFVTQEWRVLSSLSSDFMIGFLPSPVTDAASSVVRTSTHTWIISFGGQNTRRQITQQFNKLTIDTIQLTDQRDTPTHDILALLPFNAAAFNKTVTNDLTVPQFSFSTLSAAIAHNQHQQSGFTRYIIDTNRSAVSSSSSSPTSPSSGLTLITLSQPCSIEGVSAAHRAVIDCAGRRCFMVRNCLDNPVEFRYLVLTHGYDDISGSAITSTSSWIKLSDVSITDCHTNGEGGAIAASKSIVDIDRCTFDNNTASILGTVYTSSAHLHTLAR